MYSEETIIERKFIALGKKYYFKPIKLKSFIIIVSTGVYTNHDLAEIMDIESFYGISCNKDQTINFCFKIKP